LELYRKIIGCNMLTPKARFERGQASRNMNHPIIMVSDNVEDDIPLF
jgi:hypothetical protein